ncbi:hypothetical protein FIBSPDRAFT_925640 [Athelia psychrophila]|uniref:CENP-V/GFA domain-containing protein n=1 Tax=Athelia psychrophila TaxID=1759441 RepID=A0A166ULK4_9AGAM|nr:hypothetical protein FIBSPDRAFT_925640 [Fibularhizoctonia sp. CBS 109695]
MSAIEGSCLCSGTKVKIENEDIQAGYVTHTFCTECGGSISHKSAAFGDATAVQASILVQPFKNVKVSKYFFTEGRWVAFSDAVYWHFSEGDDVILGTYYGS